VENDREIELHQATARILKCTCEHSYQDEKFGKGKRLHNKAGKDSTSWRCTICGNVKK
jgi:hypothetical protein